MNRKLKNFIAKGILVIKFTVRLPKTIPKLIVFGRKYFEETFHNPLLFKMLPLPLHSKLKNGILKFFKYVTTNQNQITVLRPQCSR